MEEVKGTENPSDLMTKLANLATSTSCELSWGWSCGKAGLQQHHPSLADAGKICWVSMMSLAAMFFGVDNRGAAIWVGNMNLTAMNPHLYALRTATTTVTSPMVLVIGFSHQTSLPASAAIIDISPCQCGGVAI